MFHLGRIASKLLIWLTAVSMPFQAGWAMDCGCCRAQEPLAIDAQSGSTKCCHRVAAATAACCQRTASQRTCCHLVVASEMRTGCHCGLNCQCVDRDESPAKPMAPAADNGRSHSAPELAVSPLDVTCTPPADSNARADSSATGSAFHQAGAQVCVLLCRFTL